ncbi:hypothetical protein V7128_07280 [Neobacillus vireti]|uniref:hypothetical protein n=1 Tax=Neobacillus vireti TaxID=220686 RepID=UPI002FFE8DDF
MLGFIPMPHVAKILRATDALDDWGLPVLGTESEQVACKITYNSTNESITVASGDLVRYQATILFEGLPKISYSDFVEWSDDWGNVHKKQPLNIDYKHDLSGNPVALRVTV